MLSGGHVFSLFGHPRMTPADRLREHFSIGEHASARTRRSRRLAWSTAGTLSFPFPAFSIASQRRSALLECGVETTYTGHTRRCSPAAVAFSRTVLLVLASYTAQLTYNASTPTHTQRGVCGVPDTPTGKPDIAASAGHREGPQGTLPRLAVKFY